MAEEVGVLSSFSSWLVSASGSASLGGRTFPTLNSVCVSARELLLRRAPSLHRLDGRYPRLRRLLRYYERVRLLAGSSPRLSADAFPGLLGGDHHPSSAIEVSRFPC